MEYLNNTVEYIRKKHNNRNKDREEFESIIEDVVKHRIVREMKNYNHHSYTSCFKHSLHVSYYNYKICKKLGWDAKAGAKAGLLHDLFLYDWHGYKPKTGERLHGFEHPLKSLKNAREYFDITRKEGDIISKHMFPLTVTPPRFKETYVIILTDKFCSACEVMDRFFSKKSKQSKYKFQSDEGKEKQ